MRDPVLEEKLESVRRCLERVRTRTPADVGDFARDLDAQDIVTINLERAVQACVDIALHVLVLREGAPRTMAEAFVCLAQQRLISEPVAERMVKAVGFRNLAVHAYRQIDWNVVHSIATLHLEDFRSFMREIVASNDLE